MVLAIVALIVPGLGLGGCQATPSSPLSSTGPTVGVQNETDIALRVRFWVGERKEQGSGPKMRNEQELTVVPRGNVRYQLGLTSGFSNTRDSFVRVEVEPVAASFADKDKYWFELNPPPPYTLRVKQKGKELVFERQTGATMTPVPRSLWVRKAN